MENVTYKMQDNTLVFAFNGKISSENAAAVEEIYFKRGSSCYPSSQEGRAFIEGYQCIG